MKFNSIIRKIKTPPAAQNLVRLIDVDDEAKTTNNVANFALSIPSFNYVSGTKMCVDRVKMGLDIKTALAAVAKSGAPEGRKYNADFVKAFFQHDEKRGYSTLKYVDSYHGQYRISRDINVPTTPTFTVIEKGMQTPVVLCGWKDLMLTKSQLQMWLTKLESGLFSYGDYRHSPAEVLIFPEEKIDDQSIRQPHVIKRGEIQCYTEAEMRDIVAMYARAQEAAMPIAEMRWLEREERRRQKQRDIANETPRGDSVDVGQPDMFADEDKSL